MSTKIYKEIRDIKERLDIIERQLPDRSYFGTVDLNMLSSEEYSPKIPFDIGQSKNKKSKKSNKSKRKGKKQTKMRKK
jgi:hypothetical protein